MLIFGAKIVTYNMHGRIDFLFLARKLIFFGFIKRIHRLIDRQMALLFKI